MFNQFKSVFDSVQSVFKEAFESVNYTKNLYSCAIFYHFDQKARLFTVSILANTVEEAKVLAKSALIDLKPKCLIGKIVISQASEEFIQLVKKDC